MTNRIETSIIISSTFLKVKRQSHHTLNPFEKKENARTRRLLEIRRMKLRLLNERYLFFQTITRALFRKQRSKSPFRFWEKVKIKLTCNQWLKYFKMSKNTFNIVTNTLNPYVNAEAILYLSNSKKIAIALICLASGKSNKYIGRMFSVSESDVATIIRNISTAILKLMPKYIKVPNEKAIKNIVESFENKWGFPQTAGVLGSVHIPIQPSSLPENASDYMNSVGGYSMILQGVVDASYLFWDLNIGWPGSVPESRVLTSSSLWLKGQERTLFSDYPRKLGNVDVPLFILAGSSYPLSHWVMRPFLVESLSKEEKKFNDKFSFAYNACEIAFKRLKARWNCLVSGNICAVEDFPTIISACCILHNICEEQKEIISDDWIVKAETYYKQPIPQLCNTVIGPQAENFRQAIKEHFVSSE